MADSYDKRAAGWNPFNLQPLQQEDSLLSVILHRQAAGERAKLELTGGGGEFSQARERTTLQFITPISISLTLLNTCMLLEAQEEVTWTQEGHISIQFSLQYVTFLH